MLYPFMVLLLGILWVLWPICVSITTENVTALVKFNATEKPKTVDIISFPYEDRPCAIKGLGCICCQGIYVQPLDMEKNACVQFALKLLPLSLVVSIQMDNSTVATFVIDPKNPPSYCIPVLLPGFVAMCIKLDIKMVGLFGIQVCSTLYASYDTEQIFNYTMPCVKLSTGGVMITSSSGL